MQEAGANAAVETQEPRDLQAQQAEGLGSQVYPASIGTQAPHSQGAPSEQDVQRLQVQLQHATQQDPANLLQQTSSMLGVQAAESGLHGDGKQDSDHQNEHGDEISKSEDASIDDAHSNHHDAASSQAGLHLAAAESDVDGNDDSGGDSDADSDEEGGYLTATERREAAEATAAAAQYNLAARMGALRNSQREHLYADPGPDLPLLAAWLLHSQRLSADSMASKQRLQFSGACFVIDETPLTGLMQCNNLQPGAGSCTP